MAYSIFYRWVCIRELNWQLHIIIQFDRNEPRDLIGHGYVFFGTLTQPEVIFSTPIFNPFYGKDEMLKTWDFAFTVFCTDENSIYKDWYFV